MNDVALEESVWSLVAGRWKVEEPDGLGLFSGSLYILISVSPHLLANETISVA